MISGELNRNCSGRWSDSESGESSTWVELEAVNRLLPRLAESLKGQCVRWNVDNANVLILTGGSMKPHLQVIAIQILKALNVYSIVYYFHSGYQDGQNARADAKNNVSFRMIAFLKKC